MADDTSTDAVTGALPRAAMRRRLDEEVAAAGRFALFLFDVDFFKTVNDVYGHLRGDLVLRQLADRVTGALRERDVLFRYGGDEFVVLLPDTGGEQAVALAVDLADEVKRTPFPGDPALHLSVSLGVASYPADGHDQAGLLACADRRNYLAKHRGRGIAVADDVDTAADAEAAAAGGGSSRLWERDAAVSAVHDFLTRVRTTHSGALRVTGPPGAGFTRFLAEVRRIATLRGFTVHTCGERGHPPGTADPPELSGLRGAEVVVLADREAAGGLEEAVARVVAAGAATVAVVHAAATGDPAFRLGPDLLAEVELGPWPPAILRIWLRSALRGEPSRALVAWVAGRSGGLPAAASAELERLRQRNGLVPAAGGGWTIDPSLGRRSRRQVSLPAQMTRLIGREREINQIAGLLRETRLVTLVGVGGIGKTRLSLAAASSIAERFDDGVVFVPLDTCTDDDMVTAALAHALHVGEVPGEDLLDALADRVAEASLLLVLDNLEQALGAAPVVGRLLSAGAGLHVLATSREPVGVYGEQLYPVPPLGLPEADLPPGTAGVAMARREAPAVVLFEQRAKAAQPGFTLSPETLPQVTALCRRLDGLPLAIELAAAHIGRMDAAGLLEHLGRYLDAPGVGPGDRPERQRTLRGALEWSYTLLDAGQQRDFAALAVFVGGCTPQAAADVAGPDPARLAVLVEKSLLVHDEGRFRMLETVRAYAATMLAPEVRGRHCTYYTELAERAAAGLESPDQVRWVEDLEREHPNLRAALSWAVDEGDLDRARRICHGLWRFWRRGGHIREGREWLQRLLAMDDGGGVRRARLLYPAAVLAATQDDHETAARLGEEGLRLAEAAGDAKLTAQARNVLGAAALAAGKYDEAAGHFRTCLEICRATGDGGGTTIALGNLAKLSLRLGEIDQAAAYIDQCLALERAAGNSGGILLGLECQGEILHAQGRLDEARRVLDESLALSRDLGDVFGEAMALHQLGSVARAGGDRAGALDGYLAAITLRHEVDDREGLAVTLECTAGVLADDQPERAVRLLAAADVLRERYRLPVPPEQEQERETVLRRSRLRLGEQEMRDNRRAGRETPLDLIIDEVTGAGGCQLSGRGAE